MMSICHVDDVGPISPTEQMEHQMSLLTPLDPAFPVQQQIEIEADPVVLVNVFTVGITDEPAFLSAWESDEPS